MNKQEIYNFMKRIRNRPINLRNSFIRLNSFSFRNETIIRSCNIILEAITYNKLILKEKRRYNLLYKLFHKYTKHPTDVIKEILKYTYYEKEPIIYFKDLEYNQFEGARIQKLYYQLVESKID